MQWMSPPLGHVARCSSRPCSLLACKPLSSHRDLTPAFSMSMVCSRDALACASETKRVFSACTGIRPKRENTRGEEPEAVRPTLV